jgi:hypothetical protein
MEGCGSSLGNEMNYGVCGVREKIEVLRGVMGKQIHHAGMASFTR